jgi:predicted dehydrogenase
VSKKRFGVGIRGTGQVAVQHVLAVQANPHSYVAAVCGRSKEKAEEFIALHTPGAKAYGEYEAMLDDQSVDIVSECMPNHLHSKEGVLALDAGKHLMLEKPVGNTPEETKALLDAALRSDKKTVVSFVLRWHPMVQNIKSLLNRNAFGEVYYAQADYWHGISPRFSSYQWIRQRQYAGGAMITGGSHATDIIRYLHGEVAEVHAFATKARDDFDYLTTYVAAVRFVDGSVGKLSASLDGLASPYQFNIDLLGTKGLCRDNRFYARDLFPYQDDWMEFASITPNSGAVDHHPFKEEFNDLIDAIINDGKALCTVEDACKSMDIVHAINESVSTKKPVLLS